MDLQTKDAVYTLSAMTSGIRRNWIEALRKTVRPTSAPDVTKYVLGWTKARGGTALHPGVTFGHSPAGPPGCTFWGSVSLATAGGEGSEPSRRPCRSTGGIWGLSAGPRCPS